MSGLPFAVPPEVAGFLTDPRFGVPFAIAAVALGAWLYWNPLGAPTSLGTRSTWRTPDRDAVSRTYYALAEGRVSHVVAASYEGLEAAVVARFHRSLGELPVTGWGRRRTGIAPARELRRLAGQLREAYQQALQWEGTIRIRWAFWRTPAEERRRFEGRVRERLTLTRHMIATLEHGP